MVQHHKEEKRKERDRETEERQSVAPYLKDPREKKEGTENLKVVGHEIGGLCCLREEKRESQLSWELNFISGP